MRKAHWLMFGLALLGGAAQASAQETAKTTTARAGYIGIRYDEAHEIFMPAERRSDRVVVRAISKDSPAEKAGVKVGDEIMRINGMSSANGKFSAVARTLTVGDTVKLRIKRDNSERDITLVAAARPAGTYTAVFGDRTIVFSADSVRGLAKLWMDSAMVHLDSINFPRVYIQPGDSSIDIRIRKWDPLGKGDTLVFRRDTVALRALGKRWEESVPPDVFKRIEVEGELGPGMVFRTMELGSRAIAGAEFTVLDPGMKTYFGTDRGLLTLRVAAETPAARAGLQPGDIVKRANGRDVSRVGDLRSLIFDNQGTIKLEVLRKGETKTLEIKPRNKSGND